MDPLHFYVFPKQHFVPFRKRIFYGQKVKMFVQKPGETLYMPNLVLHSVWNLSPTISVGNNPLYESSFVEHLGSGNVGSSKINQEIIHKISSRETPLITDTIRQINRAIRDQNILHYTSPKIWKGYNSLCRKHT